MVEDADQEAKKNKCKICGVPGGIKTMKEVILFLMIALFYIQIN